MVAERNAYVLTRVYVEQVTDEFVARFCRAVRSVATNANTYKHGSVRLVLHDDSPDASSHQEQLLEWCSSSGFSLDKGNLFYSAAKKPGNSSLALFSVKEKFLSITHDDATAFAVLLDQDDTLYPDAIRQIASAMPDNGIVLNRFTIINEGGKDITGGGGDIQRKVTQLINNGVKPAMPGRLAAAIGIWNASSLGWSKAYSRSALHTYQSSLQRFLDDCRGGVEAYYACHDAYEDFVDFYMLLRTDVTIAATTRETHKYYKHGNAITCNPSLDAFRLHRAANLLLLIDLCYAERSMLYSNFEKLLLRYVAVKVVDVERIMAEYRWDYEKGNDNYELFEENTADGWFLDNLYRLANGSGKDSELLAAAAPVRTDATARNFNNLFSLPVCAGVYDLNIVDDNSRLVLHSVCCAQGNLKPDKDRPEGSETSAHSSWHNLRTLWARLRGQSSEIPPCANSTKIIDDKCTPNQKRWWWILAILIVLVVLIVILCVAWWGQIHDIISREGLINTIIQHSGLLTLLSLPGAILSFFLNEWSKASILAQKEVAKKKLYYSEFEDLIRHLEANLKVMIEVRKQLKPGIEPANIHFINLAWPKTSCLFSDDISGIIDEEYVNEFARIKVNLRNVQNSSQWLSVFVKEKHTTAEKRQAIDWEIARHIGYLVNFHFMTAHGFRFPTRDELDAYVKEKQLKRYLASMFMSYCSSRVMVDKYLGMYYDDRRVRRNVVLYTTP